MKFEEVGASITQAPRTLGGKMNIVLQPDAAPTRKIDPRLHRDYRAGGQRGLGGTGEAWGLMALQPDPVAQRMAERLLVSRRRDDVPRQRVGFAPREAGPDRLASDALRPLHDLVDLPLPDIRRGADDHRTGQIGTVALELGAEIQQEPLAFSNLPRVGAGMRQGAARARGHHVLKRVPFAAAP